MLWLATCAKARGYKLRRGEEFPPLFATFSCLNESLVTREVHGRERFKGN